MSKINAKSRFTTGNRMTLALLAAGVVAAGLFTRGPLLAAPPKDTLVATPQTTLGGVTPTVNPSDKNWHYAWCVGSGSGVTDNIPVNVSVTDTASATGPYAISFSKSGGPLSGSITLPANFNVNDDSAVVTKNIILSTGVLADGTYNNIIQVSGPSGQLINSPTIIHIQITVGSSCTTPNTVSCLLTSSSFLNLTDCSLADVTGNTGGTFPIVTNNKNIIVATNPGSFYYNLFWTNTSGTSKTVKIEFQGNNVIPQGANSVHAYTFSTSGFTKNQTNFDLVNQDGTPCGPFGPCTITVAAGDTLWATWHVQYSQIGTSASGLPSACSTTCSGRSQITAEGILTDVTDPNNPVAIGNCTATACGYLKKP